MITYISIIPIVTMITYLSKLLSNLVLTPVSSSDPPGSDLQHGSSTTGLVDPPQGEWIPVVHKGKPFRNKKSRKFRQRKIKVSVAKSTSGTRAHSRYIANPSTKAYKIKQSKSSYPITKSTNPHPGLYAYKFNSCAYFKQSRTTTKKKISTNSTKSKPFKLINHKGNKFSSKPFSHPKGKYSAKVLKHHKRIHSKTKQDKNDPKYIHKLKIHACKTRKAAWMSRNQGFRFNPKFEKLMINHFNKFKPDNISFLNPTNLNAWIKQLKTIDHLLDSITLKSKIFEFETKTSTKDHHKPTNCHINTTKTTTLNPTPHHHCFSGSSLTKHHKSQDTNPSLLGSLCCNDTSLINNSFRCNNTSPGKRINNLGDFIFQFPNISKLSIRQQLVAPRNILVVSHNKSFVQPIHHCVYKRTNTNRESRFSKCGPMATSNNPTNSSFGANYELHTPQTPSTLQQEPDSICLLFFVPFTNPYKRLVLKCTQQPIMSATTTTNNSICLGRLIPTTTHGLRKFISKANLFQDVQVQQTIQMVPLVDDASLLQSMRHNWSAHATRVATYDAVVTTSVIATLFGLLDRDQTGEFTSRTTRFACQFDDLVVFLPLPAWTVRRIAFVLRKQAKIIPSFPINLLVLLRFGGVGSPNGCPSAAGTFRHFVGMVNEVPEKKNGRK